MNNTYTNLLDRAAEYEDHRNDRANSDDGARGGYRWWPDYFRPVQALIFRASNYAYTYALLETPRDKMLSRLDRHPVKRFLRYHRHVLAMRMLYQPRYCGQPAPRMNIERESEAA